jgi:hypothetical protein
LEERETQAAVSLRAADFGLLPEEIDWPVAFRFRDFVVRRMLRNLVKQT